VVPQGAERRGDLVERLVVVGPVEIGVRILRGDNRWMVGGPSGAAVSPTSEARDT
jgi:hypothetical protein